MKKRFLEAGQIVGTHGVKGEVRLNPWCDGPEFLSGLKTLYLDGEAVKVTGSRAHGNILLLKLEGVSTVEDAMRLKGRVLLFDREDVDLPEDRDFICDLIGLSVLEADNGAKLGEITDVLNLPANDVYVVRDDTGREAMIPAVPEFIAELDTDAGYIRVKPIKGMFLDED